MKLNDVKHNHSLTDLLKVLLFAIVMLLPFIDVAVRCGYVMLNKNAYLSYSETRQVETLYETNEVNTLTDLVVGRAYTYTFDENITSQCRLGIEKILINNNLSDYEFSEISNIYDATIRTNFTYNGVSYNTFGITPLNDTQNAYTTKNTIDFIYGNTNYNQNADIIISCISQCNNLPISEVVNPNGTLDNVFEYSVSKIEESQLYNWTTQTAIYTGVSQMTGQLGITTNIIPIIVCYWFFITIIYIILDIVIRLFTILTHFIGSKTAN